MKRWCELSGFFVLVATATRLFGAPPEPVQLPVPTLGLGTAINQEFTKLTKFGITPFLAYYGVFQGNPLGGIQQRTAYSHLVFFGATLNLDGGNPTAEHVLEVSYAIYLTNNYTIQPDIQYVIRPNGTDAVRNSLVILNLPSAE
jgi:hypothetical protein